MKGYLSAHSFQSVAGEAEEAASFYMQTSLAQGLYQESDEHVDMHTAEAHDIYLLHSGECMGFRVL